jgi:hypothetical protein
LRENREEGLTFVGGGFLLKHERVFAHLEFFFPCFNFRLLSRRHGFHDPIHRFLDLHLLISTHFFGKGLNKPLDHQIE